MGKIVIIHRNWAVAHFQTDPAPSWGPLLESRCSASGTFQMCRILDLISLQRWGSHHPKQVLIYQPLPIHTAEYLSYTFCRLFSYEYSIYENMNIMNSSATLPPPNPGQTLLFIFFACLCCTKFACIIIYLKKRFAYLLTNICNMCK